MDGNQGFIIKRKLMKQFLNQSFPIREASDLFMVGLIHNMGVKAYISHPPLLKFASFRSDIQAQTKL